MSGSSGHEDEGAASSSDLSAKQMKALDALVQEPTVARAATVAGVNERTLRRWLGETKFHAALLSARREAFSQAIGLTQRYAAVAVASLVQVMHDPAAPPTSKVSAAAVMLKFGREGIELDDLAARIEALERATKGGAWG